MASNSRRTAVRLEDSFAYILYKSARLLRYHFVGLMSDLGLEVTQEQWFILNRLSERKGQSQTELCDGLLEDRPNITRMLTTMERNGWLTRESDPIDARKLRVSLTVKGTSIHARIRDLVLAERRVLFAGLSTRDLNELKRILARLEQNMASSRAAPSPNAKRTTLADR